MLRLKPKGPKIGGREAKRQKVEKTPELKKLEGVSSSGMLPDPSASEMSGKEIGLVLPICDVPPSVTVPPEKEVEIVDLAAESKGLTLSSVTEWIATEVRGKAEAEAKIACLQRDLESYEAEMEAAQDKHRAQLADMKKQVLEAEARASDYRRRLVEYERAYSDLETAFQMGLVDQREMLRAYTRRLLLSDSFSDMANDIADLINGGSILAYMEDVAKDFPGLDLSKYELEKLEDGELLPRYAAVVKRHFGKLKVLEELFSVQDILTPEMVASGSADRIKDLDSIYDSLPEELEELQERERAPEEVKEKAPEDPSPISDVNASQGEGVIPDAAGGSISVALVIEGEPSWKVVAVEEVRTDP